VSCEFGLTNDAWVAVVFANQVIFCEKAIASSIERLDEITDVFQRNGTRLATGQFRRYDRRFEVMRDAIRTGEIGTPTGAVFFGESSLMHFLLGDPGIERSAIWKPSECSNNTMTVRSKK
jgi:predicted dehydrogenase